MNNILEKYKTVQELQDDLVGLKLRLAFQEELEDEIQEISSEQITDPEMQAAMRRLDSRILGLIRKHVRKRRIRRAVKVTLPQFGKAVAVCLLIFYIGLSTAIAAVPSVRKSVLHFIMRIEERYTSLEFAGNGIETEVPKEWRGRYYLSYIPDGFVYESTDGFEVSYVDSHGNMLLFAEYGTESSVNIDTENAKVQFVDIQGHSVLLSEKNGWVTLAWAVSDCFFILDFQGDVDEAMRIAENVGIIC